MAKSNFPQPLLRSSLLHDPEIILILFIWCSGTFSVLKTVVLLVMYIWNSMINIKNASI